MSQQLTRPPHIPATYVTCESHPEQQVADFLMFLQATIVSLCFKGPTNLKITRILLSLRPHWQEKSG